MKISKERYLRAKKKVVEAESAQKIVDAWEKQVAAMEDKMAGLEVVSIEINADGKVQATCKEQDEVAE